MITDYLHDIKARGRPPAVKAFYGVDHLRFAAPPGSGAPCTWTLR